MKTEVGNIHIPVGSQEWRLRSNRVVGGKVEKSIRAQRNIFQVIVHNLKYNRQHSVMVTRKKPSGAGNQHIEVLASQP